MMLPAGHQNEVELVNRNMLSW